MARANTIGSIRKSDRRQATSLLRSGSRFKSFDQIRQRHFWSVYTFTADANGYVQATNNATVFTTPQGQNGQGLPSGQQMTELETNWKGQNRVPDNQNIMITEIGVELAVVPVGIRDAEEISFVPTGKITEQFLENTLVGITYLTNTIELGRCSDFGQPSAPSLGTYQPYGGSNIPNVVPQRAVSNGFAAPGLRRRFNVPILLGHGETFSFVFIVPRTYSVEVAGLQLYARLDFWATESFVEKS